MSGQLNNQMKHQEVDQLLLYYLFAGPEIQPFSLTEKQKYFCSPDYSMIHYGPGPLVPPVVVPPLKFSCKPFLRCVLTWKHCNQQAHLYKPGIQWYQGWICHVNIIHSHTFWWTISTEISGKHKTWPPVPAHFHWIIIVQCCLEFFEAVGGIVHIYCLDWIRIQYGIRNGPSFSEP